MIMMIQTFLSLSILLLSTSATELLEQYYFQQEIEFLGKQVSYSNYNRIIHDIICNHPPVWYLLIRPWF